MIFEAAVDSVTSSCHDEAIPMTTACASPLRSGEDQNEASVKASWVRLVPTVIWHLDCKPAMFDHQPSLNSWQLDREPISTCTVRQCLDRKLGSCRFRQVLLHIIAGSKSCWNGYMENARVTAVGLCIVIGSSTLRIAPISSCITISSTPWLAYGQGAQLRHALNSLKRRDLKYRFDHSGANFSRTLLGI